MIKTNRRKKWIGSAITVLTALPMLIISTPASAATQVSSLPLLFANMGTNGGCLSGSQGTTPELTMQTCNQGGTAPNQLWVFTGNSTQELIDQANGLCLAGNPSATPEVTLQTCNTANTEQNWGYVGENQLSDLGTSNLCLVGNQGQSPTIKLATCNESSFNQQWGWISVLDFPTQMWMVNGVGCLSGSSITTPDVTMQQCNINDLHQFFVVPFGGAPLLGDDLIDAANGLCLSGSSSRTPEVTLQTCNTADQSQLWMATASNQLADYADTNLCLAGSPSTNPEVTLATCNSNDPSQWWG
jgi:hypothetical protein